MLWLILLMGLIIGILIYWEYRENDRSKSHLYQKHINEDPLRSVDEIQKALKSNYEYTSWRLCLIVGIVAAFPIIYYIEGRIPTLFEWMIVGGLIFIASYLSCSWIWEHFYRPNGTQIDKNLLELRDKIHKLINNSDTNANNTSYNDNIYSPYYHPDNIVRREY